MTDTLNLIAIHHASDLINQKEKKRDDLQRLKDKAKPHRDTKPVTMDDVVNLLWKHSTKNGTELKQKNQNGKERVYHQLLKHKKKRGKSHHAHLDYVDTLNVANHGMDEMNDQYFLMDNGQDIESMQSMRSWMRMDGGSSDGYAVNRATADEDHMLWALVGFNLDMMVIITCLAVLLCKILCGLGACKVIKLWIDRRRKRPETELQRESEIGNDSNDESQSAVDAPGVII